MNKAQIISNPKILGGKPVIAGTRISVELILDRISTGMSEKEILIDYPHLTAKDTTPVTLYTHEISR